MYRTVSFFIPSRTSFVYLVRSGSSSIPLFVFCLFRSAGYWGAAAASGRAEAEGCSRGSVPVGGAAWLPYAAQQLSGSSAGPSLHPAPHSTLCWRGQLRHTQPGELRQHRHQRLHQQQLRLLAWQHVQVGQMLSCTANRHQCSLFPSFASRPWSMFSRHLFALSVRWIDRSIPAVNMTRTVCRHLQGFYSCCKAEINSENNYFNLPCNNVCPPKCFL